MMKPVDLFYSLHISIRGSDPLIWRRVEVPGVMPLYELNEFIMGAVLWDGFDLSTFVIRGAEIDPERDSRYWLQDLVEEGDRFEWVYAPETDFWGHEIHVESVRAFPGREWVPVLLAGERACPGDWTGGIAAYQEYVGHWRDADHPATQKMVDLVGESVDPAALDLEADFDHLNYYKQMRFTLPFRGEMVDLLDEHSIWCEESFRGLLAGPGRWGPVLLESLRRISSEPDAFLKLSEMYFPTLALYALAGMGNANAAEMIRRIARLDRSLLLEFFFPIHDLEPAAGWGRLLATLHVNSPKELFPLVLESNLDETLGEGVLTALWTLHLEGKISLAELRAGLPESLVNDLQSDLFRNEGLIIDVVAELTEVLGFAAEHNRRRFRPIGLQRGAFEEEPWFLPRSVPIVRETPKVGRNDPCPCGSGKKYKKCCGA